MLISLFRRTIIVFCLFSLSIAQGYAAEVLPSGCIAFVIKNDFVNLKASKDMFIFIHNLSENNVWLVNQAKMDEPESPLSSNMSPGSWSALALKKDSHKLKISCIESKPGHEQKISCQDVLAVCEWPSTKLPEDRKGVFFVAESMDLSSLKAYSERNGYSLAKV